MHGRIEHTKRRRACIYITGNVQLKMDVCFSSGLELRSVGIQSYDRSCRGFERSIDHFPSPFSSADSIVELELELQE